MKKTTTNIWIYVIVLTLVIGFVSCKKDSDTSVPDPTSVLMSKNWKVSKSDPQTSNIDLMVAAAIYVAFVEPTEYKFLTGGVLKYNDLLSYEHTGTWKLSTDNKTLTLTTEEAKVSTVEITEALSSSIKWKKIYTKAELESTSDVTVIYSLIPKA